jgi:DNA (cytosine-5)-methyltransferase 1
MHEIRRLRPCGLEVVSLFSGGGGSSLGYAMAGFKVLLASEFVEAARDTYAANFPKTRIDARDIRLVKPADILKAIGKKAGELDVLDGSPPCASFSTAGKREAHWGEEKAYSDTRQRTDDLFFEYARILDGVRPRAFVAENVSGLVKGSAKGYFKEILARLKSCGYRVEARLLDAQWLGVPQTRQRIIFVGFREDLGIDPAHPQPLPYRYTLREVFEGMAKIVHDTSNGPNTTFSVGDVTDRPCPAITSGVNGLNSVHYKVYDIERFAIGDEWKRLAPGATSERYFNLIRSDVEKPSPTVTAEGGNPGAAAVTHPSEPRKFTIPELKLVCSFPEDFVLTGTYTQQWERCGRAVPPLMMRAVARVVRDKLLAAKKR